MFGNRNIIDSHTFGRKKVHNARPFGRKNATHILRKQGPSPWYLNKKDIHNEKSLLEK